VVLPGLVVVATAAKCKGYRHPIGIIGQAVWLYHRFALSLRDVEELEAITFGRRIDLHRLRHTHFRIT
jgi:transposase-like protein